MRNVFDVRADGGRRGGDHRLLTSLLRCTNRAPALHGIGRRRGQQRLPPAEPGCSPPQPPFLPWGAADAQSPEQRHETWAAAAVDSWRPSIHPSIHHYDLEEWHEKLHVNVVPDIVESVRKTRRTRRRAASPSSRSLSADRRRRRTRRRRACRQSPPRAHYAVFNPHLGYPVRSSRQPSAHAAG